MYVEVQAGFRKSMSTVDNIFILNSLVVRDILWHKLIKVGVRVKMLDIIRSM